MRGADALIAALEGGGVDTVFGMPGGASLPLYDALLDSGIRHVLMRHEAGAGHAAEGYARATGQVGVAFATSGPGATNLVTPICDAHMDSIPTVFVTGQVRTSLRGTNAFQEADVIGITTPIVKHSIAVERPDDVAQAIADALHLARAGRPGPVLVDVDVDPSEIGKNVPAHIPIVGCARRALAAIAAAYEGDRARLDEWWTRIDGWRDDPSPRNGAEAALDALDAAKSDAIVTTDVGQHQMWAANRLRFDAPRRWITSGGLGTMGFGLPAAIGAQVARPDATVVCVTGEGSLLINVQELATAAHERLPVKVVMLDNASLGMVRQQQDLFWDGRRSHVDLGSTPDWTALAAAFGVAGREVDADGDVEAAMTETLAEPGPALLRVRIDPDDDCLPMFAPGGAAREMMGLSPARQPPRVVVGPAGRS